MTYADRSLAKPASLKTNRWPKHSIVQLARSDTPILREVERVGCVLALPLSGGLHHRYARVRNVRQGRRPSFHGLNKKLPNGPPIARSNLAVPAMRHVLLIRPGRVIPSPSLLLGTDMSFPYPDDRAVSAPALI